MESAGKSLAEEVGKIAVYTFSKPVKVVIFTGSGGNGGDGFVAARYLLNRGYDVDIYMLKDNIRSFEAKTNFEILQNMRPRLSRLNVYNLKTLEDIDNCEIEIMKRAAPMFDQFMHITQLPGISTLSAILIISEIGVDMKQFESDKQLTCWAGLAPANNESANKKKSVRISKAGQYLKPLLVQCALGAIKDKEGYFGIKYSRIKKRRGHKKAIIAIARMMLVSIYHMILTGETFNPSDYESFRNPKPPIKQQDLTEESAIEFLKKSGFDVSKLTKQ